ncbi:MAG: AbrB/MazE/SpoVT family DNA-binding domain-containing protein [Dehalogenimonas sp.]|uniref:AbrB/MazE/SpoVT family DNA-binding domain-containing protein n=1 Tax=Candidatus Dehalogenimonas loeffleri TaxID=3127115 RepID=A0ABZ2JB42_9CHLR|nr:AbrB/MazE/SpoVT family DNA-binding domain-containing protein [Dehalogenimonas sp.]
MSELIQIRKKAQLTLPLSIRRQLNIEDGDVVDVRVQDGEIILKLKKLVDKDQAWFWSRRWQQGEAGVEADVTAGRVHEFADAGQAVAYLHKRTGGRRA